MHEERRAAEREAQRKLYEEQRQQNDAKRKEQQAKWVRPKVPGGQPQQPQHAQPQQPRSQPRPARRDAPHDGPRAVHHHGPDLDHAQSEAPQGRVEVPPRPPSADDTARRERQMLVRAYEGSTLTKANFCVLKGLTEAQLDAALAQAKQDPQPAAPEPRPDFRGARPPGSPHSNQPRNGPPSQRRSGGRP